MMKNYTSNMAEGSRGWWSSVELAWYERNSPFFFIFNVGVYGMREITVCYMNSLGNAYLRNKQNLLFLKTLHNIYFWLSHRIILIKCVLLVHHKQDVLMAIYCGCYSLINVFAYLSQPLRFLCHWFPLELTSKFNQSSEARDGCTFYCQSCGEVIIRDR